MYDSLSCVVLSTFIITGLLRCQIAFGRGVQLGRVHSALWSSLRIRRINCHFHNLNATK